MFEKKTVDKFLNLSNVGLIKNASGVGVSAENACKNTYKVYFKIENGQIVDAKFKAFGNPAFVAICDEITEVTKNQSVDGVLNLEEQINEIIDEFNAKKSYPSLFFMSALENAIKDYRKKEEKKNAKNDKNN